MLVDVIATNPALAFSAERWAHYLSAIYGYTTRCVTSADVIMDLNRSLFKDLYIVVAYDNFDLFDGSLYRISLSKLVVINYSGGNYQDKLPKHVLQAESLARYGGWTYFVQYDSFRTALDRTTRVSWLPPCTEPDLYVPTEPDPEAVLFTVFIAGNNQSRVYPLATEIVSAGGTVLTSTVGSPKDFIRACSCAKVIVVCPDDRCHRLWDTAQAVPDALAMGKPVIANASDTLVFLFDRPTYLRTYRSNQDIANVYQESIADTLFMSGEGARQRTLYDLNYKTRVKTLHDSLVDKGIIYDR